MHLLVCSLVCLSRVKVDDKAISAVWSTRASNTRSARSQWSLLTYDAWGYVLGLVPVRHIVIGNANIIGSISFRMHYDPFVNIMLTCRWNWDQTAHAVLAHELTTLFKLDDGISDASWGGWVSVHRYELLGNSIFVRFKGAAKLIPFCRSNCSNIVNI